MIASQGGAEWQFRCQKLSHGALWRNRVAEFVEAVAAWLSANALADITSATRQSLRLWSLAYD
jgi:hypothetical protein